MHAVVPAEAARRHAEGHYTLAPALPANANEARVGTEADRRSRPGMEEKVLRAWPGAADLLPVSAGVSFTRAFSCHYTGICGPQCSQPLQRFAVHFLCVLFRPVTVSLFAHGACGMFARSRTTLRTRAVR